MTPSPQKKAPKTATKPRKPTKRDGPAPDRLLRWTLSAAAREAGQHREILERKRRLLGIEAGQDGCFSTQQILKMLWGDKEAAELRKTEADAETSARRNQREAGELMPTAIALALMEPFAIAIRQRICASSMTNEEKDAILNDLVKLGEVDWFKEAKNALKRPR